MSSAPPDPQITLCTQQQLRAALRISRDYLLAMRYAGFPMPGGRNTIAEALAWLKANPNFQPRQHLAPHRNLKPKRTHAKRS